MNDTSTTGEAGMVQVIRFFLRNLLLIFGLSFASGLTLFVAAAFMTPVYRAETSLVPVEESADGSLTSTISRIGGLGRLAGLRGGGPTRSDEALAMLRSRNFISAFIDANDGLAVLYPDAWDDETGSWREGEYVPSEQDTYLRMVESVLSTSRNKDSGIVTVAVSLHDRLVATEWANEIVRSLNQKFREYVAAEAERSIEYLYGELQKASSVELRQVIHRLIETQIQTIMLTNVRKDFVFRVIDPAVAPDANYYVWPRRALLAFIGLVLGGFVGLGVALLREAILSARRVDAAASS
jgi:uncharacterized protein involved in exopolysaccharide biosynthesis